jgi:hypothetical protein
MAGPTAVRRKFFMHPPHRIVGVSGFRRSGAAPLAYPHALTEFPAADRPNTRLRHVSLVSRTADGRQAAILFERILLQRANVLCQHVRDALAHTGGIADTDCVIVFGGAFPVFMAKKIEQSPPQLMPPADMSETKVEIVPADGWHPIADGVAQFHSSCYPFRIAHPADDWTCLLVGRTQGGDFPVAWAHSGGQRSFCTLLGRPNDFRRHEFVRLVLGALDWVLD